MLTNEERTLINRRNAMKSTGPKTPAGKKKSAYNGLRHGCTGQIVVMPEEDMQAYLAFEKSFYDQYRPATPIEKQFVQIIVDASWKINRCSAWQELINTYQSELRDAGTSAANDPEVNTAIAMAGAMAHMSRVAANFSIYEQRQFRMLNAAITRLEALQQERRKQQAVDFEKAELLMNLHDREQKQQLENASADTPGAVSAAPAPYEPAADGFGFSIVEIKAHTQRQERLARAYQLLASAGAAA